MIRRDLIPLCRHPLNLLAFGFGSGLMRKAPGTFGSVAALPFLPLFAPLPLVFGAALLVVTAAAGIVICGHAGRQLGQADPGCVVWDEMVGVWLTLFAVPLSLPAVVAGFLLFRLFDIAKPWPISWCDRHLKGGLGIMVDDLVAALLAALVLRLGLSWCGQLSHWYSLY